jgi:DNA/RNA-binding protein KIN17
MPKAEKGSQKWLANKMKAKGLQKLRWYCQMCQKQCRDQNGFKCHTQSEAHQRQLLLFADNPGKFLGSFSKEFEDDFVNNLKRAYNTKRVKANKVYQEYIAHKEHVHMNATRWESLTGFVKYLGRTGKCVVEETDEGWYITWIDRDPETIARQETLSKKHRLDKDDEERLAEFIKQQVERAKELKELLDDGEEMAELPEFKRADGDEVLTLFINTKFADRKVDKVKLDIAMGKSALQEAEDAARDKKKQVRKEIKEKEGADKRKAPTSALVEIMMHEKRRRQEVEDRKKEEEDKANARKKEVKDYWLKKDIVVKIVTKSLGDKYYKQKGYVKEVVDKYAAVVSLLNGAGGRIKLDQDHLETVVPAVGKKVLVVNGHYRGKLGALKSIDVDSFSAYVTLEDGECVQVPYEHFSKLYDSEK